MKTIIIISIIVIIILILLNYLLNKDKGDLPYNAKELLTQNEKNFYDKIKDIAFDNDLVVLSKIRLADLVEIDRKSIGKDKYYKYFSKISSKHIDFALCDMETLKVKLIIELNDKSHEKEDRKQRDEFVKNVLTKANYNIEFVTNKTNIEEVLKKYLNENKELNTLPKKESTQQPSK